MLRRNKDFVWKFIGSPGKLEINKQPHSWCQWINSESKVLKAVHVFFHLLQSTLVCCLLSPPPLPHLQVLWEGYRGGGARILKGTKYFSVAKPH